MEARLSEDDHECIHFEVCGYEALNPESVCATCLDAMRHNDREGKVEFEVGDDIDEYVAELYETYDQFKVNSP